MNRGQASMLLTFLLAASVGALALAAPALADEGEEDVPALGLVQQAIAIIRSQPELTDQIEDKIADAIDAEDQEGVDIAKVEEAQTSFEAGDMEQTELLLEQAIGACPGQPVETPEGIRTPPPIASPCPAPAHLRAFDGGPIGGTAEPLLLGVAGVAILAGLYLVRRTHAIER